MSVKCPYCPETFEDYDGQHRSIDAESFVYDHITDRHQDMIPDPVQVERRGVADD